MDGLTRTQGQILGLFWSKSHELKFDTPALADLVREMAPDRGRKNVLRRSVRVALAKQILAEGISRKIVTRRQL